ncbi:MAG TPA: hypothetical protein VE685_23370, partial [Thermoanaerobaculia bacterium]|nr:hypothetical protein [Thermoanaerobaculia bacterium]
TTLTPIRVLPSAEPSHHFGFLVEAAGSTDKLEVRLEDVFPELSQTFKLRLEGWARRQLARLLRKFEEAMPESS